MSQVSAAVVNEPGAPRDLARIATDARRLVLASVHSAEAGHLGGPLSVIDLLVYLFFERMEVRADEPAWPERDRFVLSKGHSCIALYAVMALRGYFPVQELSTFDQIGSRLQGHPDMSRLPELDMSTGSLGQGFSAAIGMALGGRLAGQSFHTWVVVGDGECQEGQVWEGAQVASRYGLSNLTAFVDSNRLQQYGWFRADPASQESPIPDLARKWTAFGWRVVEANGHDFSSMRQAIRPRRRAQERPTLVILHTTKGRGVRFMEDRPEWHARPLSTEQLEIAVRELDARQP